MENPHIIRRLVPPQSAPPESGIHYIDENTKIHYFSVGTDSVADWIAQGTAATSERVQSTKIAASNMSALKPVRAIDNDQVEVGNLNSYEDARILGVTVTSALATEPLQVVQFGRISDASFAFPLNQPIYMNSFGNIVDTPPDENTDAFHVRIGFSLGPGAIFILIDEPIEFT